MSSDSGAVASAGTMGRLRRELAASPPLWWAMLYFFSLLCGYYVLRPVRDAMGASSDAAAVFPRGLIALAERRASRVGDFCCSVFSATFIGWSLQRCTGRCRAFATRVLRRYRVFIACLSASVGFSAGPAGRRRLFAGCGVTCSR